MESIKADIARADRQTRTTLSWFTPNAERDKVDTENGKFMARFALWFWQMEQCLQIFLPNTSKRSLRKGIRRVNERSRLPRSECGFHFYQSPSPRLGRKKELPNSEFNQHVGKSKGGNTTKIHAAVDKNCRPIKLLLSAGNVNDITVAPELLEGLSIRDTTVMADKAYCSRKWRQSLYSLQKDI